MVYFNSSAIAGAHFEPSTGTLSILFTSGRSYDYFSVPEFVYSGLCGAPSKGSYFNAYIRDQYAA